MLGRKGKAVTWVVVDGAAMWNASSEGEGVLVRIIEESRNQLGPRAGAVELTSLQSKSPKPFLACLFTA